MPEKEDSKKYFRIQVESQKANGTAILVDSSKPPQNGLEDLTDAYKIKYVKGENPHYLFFESSYQIPKDIISDSPGASLANTLRSVKIGNDSKEHLLKAIIDEEGNLRIIETKKNIFLTKIEEEYAKKMVEDSRNWKMLQAWV
jgi:hypothetical protein